MKALEDKILAEGKVYEGNILKVGSFLNHQVDTHFLMEMGDEIARLFKDSGVTKIVTIEASGIAMAVAAAYKMGIPFVFAKKHKTNNISGEVYSSIIHSFTHDTEYTIVISREFISKDDRILIVDDFLANGCAVNGIIDIINQAGAKVVGVSAAIEKAFQNGGDNLRNTGIKVESLAVIESMDNGTIIFRK